MAGRVSPSVARCADRRPAGVSAHRARLLARLLRVHRARPFRVGIHRDDRLNLASTSAIKFLRGNATQSRVLIGEWVLKKACAQVRQWQKDGLSAVPVAVNVSTVQFRQKGFIDLVKSILEKYELPPQFLEPELTETQIVSDPEHMLSVLQRLRDLGVKVTIDDFGTGYSNLIHLRRFPLHKLKIDRSFVRDVATDPDDAAITGTIIKMARCLGLRVIAEGVENEQQLSFLRIHNCEEIQGFYYSKPIGPLEFADCLRSGLPVARRDAECVGAERC